MVYGLNNYGRSLLGNGTYEVFRPTDFRQGLTSLSSFKWPLHWGNNRHRGHDWDILGRGCHALMSKLSVIVFLHNSMYKPVTLGVTLGPFYEISKP